MTIDGSYERGISLMNKIIYVIRPLDILLHLIHDSLQLIHLPLQAWHHS